jgi:hypothetical protein
MNKNICCLVTKNAQRIYAGFRSTKKHGFFVLDWAGCRWFLRAPTTNRNAPTTNRVSSFINQNASTTNWNAPSINQNASTTNRNAPTTNQNAPSINRVGSFINQEHKHCNQWATARIAPTRHCLRTQSVLRTSCVLICTYGAGVVIPANFIFPILRTSCVLICTYGAGIVIDVHLGRMPYAPTRHCLF